MCDAKKMKIAMLRYTEDSLFALYSNIFKFENNIRIQATVGVVLDSNPDETHLVTFNRVFEVDKQSDALVACRFEETEHENTCTSQPGSETRKINKENRNHEPGLPGTSQTGPNLTGDVQGETLLNGESNVATRSQTRIQVNEVMDTSPVRYTGPPSPVLKRKKNRRILVYQRICQDNTTNRTPEQYCVSDILPKRTDNVNNKSLVDKTKMQSQSACNGKSQKNTSETTPCQFRTPGKLEESFSENSDQSSDTVAANINGETRDQTSDTIVANINGETRDQTSDTVTGNIDGDTLDQTRCIGIIYEQNEPMDDVHNTTDQSDDDDLLSSAFETKKKCRPTIYPKDQDDDDLLSSAFEPKKKCRPTYYLNDSVPNASSGDFTSSFDIERLLDDDMHGVDFAEAQPDQTQDTSGENNVSKAPHEEMTEFSKECEETQPRQTAHFSNDISTSRSLLKGKMQFSEDSNSRESRKTTKEHNSSDKKEQSSFCGLSKPGHYGKLQKDPENAVDIVDYSFKPIRDGRTSDNEFETLPPLTPSSRGLKKRTSDEASNMNKVNSNGVHKPKAVASLFSTSNPDSANKAGPSRDISAETKRSKEEVSRNDVWLTKAAGSTATENKTKASKFNVSLIVADDVRQKLGKISTGLSEKKPIKAPPTKGVRKRRTACGQCNGCSVKTDCGECNSCTNKNLKQKCAKRKCEQLKGKSSQVSSGKQRKLTVTPSSAGAASVQVRMKTSSSDDEA